MDIGVASYGALGHVPPLPSTSNLIFQVTSEQHKLLPFDSTWLPIQ